MNATLYFRRRLGAHRDFFAAVGQSLPLAEAVTVAGKQNNPYFIGVFTDLKIIFNMAQPLLKGGLE